LQVIRKHRLFSGHNQIIAPILKPLFVVGQKYNIELFTLQCDWLEDNVWTFSCVRTGTEMGMDLDNMEFIGTACITDDAEYHVFCGSRPDGVEKG